MCCIAGRREADKSLAFMSHVRGNHVLIKYMFRLTLLQNSLFMGYLARSKPHSSEKIVQIYLIIHKSSSANTAEQSIVLKPGQLSS